VQLRLLTKAQILFLIISLSSCSVKTHKANTCPITSSMKDSQYKDLKPEDKELLDAAKAVMNNSYHPYSGFSVGAALRAKDGQIITGTNFENAAYGSTICAERAAILRANAMGIREITTIAIIGKGENFESKDVIAPCGACRQVIYEVSEIADNDIELIMSNTKMDRIIISSIKQLLPLAFGPKALGINP
jgi:cytidine deaminase